MRGLGVLMRLLYKGRYASEDKGLARLRQEKGSAEPPDDLVSERTLDRYEVDGFGVVVVSPSGGPPSADRAVVYLHGGAYTNEIVKQQWHFAALLADRIGCEVHVALYGLVPAHHADEAIAFVLGVVDRLRTADTRVHLVGDSSGGGLAMLVAQQADASVRPALTGVTVLAPWLDMSMSNPQIPALEKVDPWLSRAGLRPIAESWVDGVPTADPRVSPLFGDLAAMPALAVWVGTRDITVADCRLLRDRLAATGLRYTELEGGLHVYPLLPVPEGRRAREDIAAHVAASFSA
jgi:acetyl esterase/lipase